MVFVEAKDTDEMVKKWLDEVDNAELLPIEQSEEEMRKRQWQLFFRGEVAVRMPVPGEEECGPLVGVYER